MQSRYHQFVIPNTANDRVVVILEHVLVSGEHSYHVFDDLSIANSLQYLVQKPAGFFLLPANAFATVDVFKVTDSGKTCCTKEDDEKEAAAIESSNYPQFVFNYEVFNSTNMFTPFEPIQKVMESADVDKKYSMDIPLVAVAGKCPVENCPVGTLLYGPCYFPQQGACGVGNQPGCVSSGG